MKLFEVHIIPHEDQRYATVGDWVIGAPEAGVPHQVYISGLGGDADAEFLVLLHELMECWLCLKHGIEQKDVDQWDQAWEPSAENTDEPGCDLHAPYHVEHEAGETLERVACALLGRDWHDYEAVFERLEVMGGEGL